MRFWRWELRRWRDESERERVARENAGEPLREFVYLDEVSVFSLLASRIGALVTDFTDTQSSSLSSGVGGDAGVSTPIGKAGLSSKITASTTSGSQVMRKSTIQSTFRELHGFVQDNMVLRPVAQDRKLPEITSPSLLTGLAGMGDTWVLDAGALRRGDLVEIDVSLSADESFRASVIFSTVLEMINDLPHMPTLDIEALRNARAGTVLLEKLLVGLVPLRGEAVNYLVLDTGDRQLLVHKRLLADLDLKGVKSFPLYVVGVAEQELFWRDLRRVLFSGACYRMLCRVGRAGLHDEWTPVKLQDVLQGAIPPLGELVNEIPGILDDLGDDKMATEGHPQMAATLERYAQELSAHHGVAALNNLSAYGLPVAELSANASGIEERRGAFQAVTEAFAKANDLNVDPVVAARLRDEVSADAGLFPGTGPAVTPRGSKSDRGQRYLDTEVVAIYW